MLGNFSFGDYFKQGAVECAHGSCRRQGFGFDPEQVWVTVFGGDEELGHRPGRRGDRVLALGRRAGRAHRAARARRQLLAGGTDRSLRPVLRALPRPRSRLRPRGGSPGRRHRALPRVLEPRVHAVCSCTRTARSRRCPSRTSTPASGSSAWRRSSRTCRRCSRPTSSCPLVQLGEELSGHKMGESPGRHACAADPRGPRPWHDLPAGGRRGALQRGSRLRAAADHAARDPAGAQARASSSASSDVLVRHGDRRDGRRLSGAARAARHDPEVGERRGGELRPHARAGRAAARGDRRARQGGRDLVGGRPGRVPPARHLRLPLRADQGAARRGGAVGGRRRLRRS